jgi:hypothetical protein
MSRRTLGPAFAVLVAISGSASAARAQDVGDYAAYLALIFTPAGGLAPTPPRVAGSPTAFQLHYGYMSEPFFEPDESTHRVAITADVSAGAARVGLTAGYVMNCADGCESTDRAVMLGASVAGTVFGRVEPGEPAGTNWSVGASGSIGYAFPTGDESDFNMLSLAASLPVSLRAGARGQFIPFVAPGVGWGRVSGSDDSESGVRFMLGGGLGFTSAGGALNISIGAQKVFIEEGATLIGVQLGWGSARQ